MERTIEPRAPLELRVGLAMCIAIAVAAVIRRVVAIIHRSQSGPPQLAALDQVFASHAALTLAHILPAMALVLLIPFVLLRRSSHLGWPQVFLFPLGAVVPFTAYANERLFGWRMDRTAALALGLEKKWSITEEIKLQFKAEAFNATNTPIFAGPSTGSPNTTISRNMSVADPNQFGAWSGYGTISSTEQNFPRQIQLFGKIFF